MFLTKIGGGEFGDKKKKKKKARKIEAPYVNKVHLKYYDHPYYKVPQR